MASEDGGGRLSTNQRQMAVAQKTGIPKWTPGKWTHGLQNPRNWPLRSFNFEWLAQIISWRGSDFVGLGGLGLVLAPAAFKSRIARALLAPSGSANSNRFQAGAWGYGFLYWNSVAKSAKPG